MTEMQRRRLRVAVRRVVATKGVSVFHYINRYMLVIIAGILFLYLWLYPEVPNRIWTELRSYSGEEGGKITFETLFQATLFFLCAFYLLRRARKFLEEKVLAHTAIDTGTQHTIITLSTYFAWILTTIITLSIMGVNLKNLAIVFGALSVGIGFGLQNIVNNFVSGIIILFERPIKEGDWVVINGQEGIVKRIRIRATQLETFDNSSVLIPNADILSGNVRNWTHGNIQGRVDVPVGVAYGTDLERVRKILLKIADEEPRLLKKPEPYVWIMQFGESSIDFELRGVTGNVMQKGFIKTDLIIRIHQAFNEEGIEIPFPQRVVHVQKED